MKKDKSRRNIDVEQFELKSRNFFVYPEYDRKVDGAQNFDICLIKTSADEFNVHYDLSQNFEMIPCLPEKLDLREVVLFNEPFRMGFQKIRCKVNFGVNESHGINCF